MVSSKGIELAVCVCLKVESSGGELFPIRRGLTSTLILFFASLRTLTRCHQRRCHVEGHDEDDDDDDGG